MKRTQPQLSDLLRLRRRILSDTIFEPLGRPKKPGRISSFIAWVYRKEDEGEEPFDMWTRELVKLVIGVILGFAIATALYLAA